MKASTTVIAVITAILTTCEAFDGESCTSDADCGVCDNCVATRRSLRGLLYGARASEGMCICFVSDEFDGDELDSSTWKVFEPVGDVDISVSNGAVTFDIPAGTEHDMWIGESTAPRIYQELLSNDFKEIEVKWSSPPPTQKFQMNGIFIHDVAELSASHFLRFGSYSDGNRNLAFVSEIDGNTNSNALNSRLNGGAPDRHKVIKNGSTYTYLTALPNEAFVTQLVMDFADFPVNGIGIYAGNAAGSSSPQYTATAEYFRVTL